MKGGLETTFAVLLQTGNESAINVLIAALDSSDRDIQAGAIHALLHRSSAAGKRELIRRWNELSERWKTLVAERPGRMAGALRDAILNSDARLRANGCDAVLWTRDYDLAPVLVTAAEDRANPEAELAAQTLLALCEMLYEELAAPRRTGRGREPRAVCQSILPPLEMAVQRFELHRRVEILEAFLLLANCDNRVLKGVLQDPHDRAYLAMTGILHRSPRPGVMRLLIGFLEDLHAPGAVHQVLSRRQDVSFLRLFVKHVGREPSPVARANLRRIKSFSWLRGELTILSAFHDDEQCAVVQLLLASGLSRLEVFDVLKYLLERGRPRCRQAVVAALAEFGGAEANALVLQVLDDPDPVLRAAAVAQLRQRSIPGALARLVEFLDSPEPVVRAAAQQGLAEFQYRRLADAWDSLDDETRRHAGTLVRRVDSSAVEQLVRELRSNSRTRRLRAVEMAVAIEMVGQVEKELIELLSDDDQRIRLETLHALEKLDTAQARDAIRERLQDDSRVVAEAAEAALRSSTGAARTGGPLPSSTPATGSVVTLPLAATNEHVIPVS